MLYVIPSPFAILSKKTHDRMAKVSKKQKQNIRLKEYIKYSKTHKTKSTYKKKKHTHFYYLLLFLKK